MLPVPLPARGGRRLPAAFVAAVAALALLVPASAFGQFQVDGPEGGPADLDKRTASIAPSQAQLDAVADLGAVARWTDFGTAQSLIRHGGFLATGIQADSAADAALAFVDANRLLYRLDSTAGLEVATVAPLGANGRVVVLRQTVNGLPVSPEGAASIGLVRSASGWKVAYASSTLVGSAELSNSAELSAPQALATALDDAGKQVSLVEMAGAGRVDGWRKLDVAGLRPDQLVRRVAFATPKGGVRIAFETVSADGVSMGYRHIVDAETGAILYREGTVERLADNPTWKVFPAFPEVTKLNSFPYQYPSTDTREVWCWESAQGCDRVIANAASPLPWDVDPTTLTSTNTTIGNNANSKEVWIAPVAPQPPPAPPPPTPGTFFRPTSATRDYQYPWANIWFESGCDPAQLATPGVTNDIAAATANLFVMHNRMHDWSYNLGFTEITWNAQQSNFGRGALGNDPVDGRSQAGAIFPGSRDNANMSTQPDGTPSITNMFLWQPAAAGFYAPCVDGDYDMAVIGHEYGHMIENRMIGKSFRRMGDHAGAMGESSGDLLAMEYLNEYRFVPVSGENEHAVGAYVTGNPFRAIRNYDMSFPSTWRFPSPSTTPDVNPLNLSDVAYDIVGEQVHADGEIWSATNFDIRDLFLDRYPNTGYADGVACADGIKPVAKCEGNRRWVQIMFDAYLLMPIAPTFLDARDAYLAADLIRFGGANQDILWRGFARRGFGVAASVTGNGDDQPIPSWESPLQGEATLTFEAEDEAGNPVDATVYVGNHEARVTPIDDIERFVTHPEGYVFVAKAPGHGFTRFWVRQLRAGENRTITIRFAENWAASANGATAAGNGERHADLIDETEATNWQDLTAPVAGRQVTVSFGGLRDFRLARVSAYLLPPQPQPPPQDPITQNRFSALRAFELHACTAGADAANPTCDGAVAAGWTKILTSPDDAFPATPPRPVSPHLLLRTFQLPRTSATHVRLTVLTNQCTGNPAFNGEQDNDPRSTTHCTGTPIANQVRVAELQILSHRTQVAGAFRVD
jgi:extracellular elastinolytic metalloproteinase